MPNKITDVIILAAGKSSRYSKTANKLNQKIGNKSIIDISIEKFLKKKLIRDIYIAVGDTSIKIAASNRKMVNLVKGSSSRMNSVLNVLRSLNAQKSPPDNVIIHDAARPFVYEKDLKKLFSYIPKIKTGIGFGYPLTNALKYIGRNGIIEKNLSRKNLYMTFTPQLLNFSRIIKSYEYLNKNKITVDDDLEALHLNSYKVRIMKSSPFNVKLTYKSDFENLVNGIQKL
tara:strand:+ start:37246 stop:37932 length:687 start_codon:yes stop_codon:yes gene_type:complete